MSTPATPAPDNSLGTVTAYGQEFHVTRKPPTLLLAELGRTGSGDPEAMGVIAEFFSVTLGADEYRRFKKAAYGADNGDDVEVLMEALTAVLSVAMPDTPTQ